MPFTLLRIRTDIAAQVNEFSEVVLRNFQKGQPSFKCQIEVSSLADLPRANVSVQEIGRVWLNIFNNAFESIHDRNVSSDDPVNPRVAVRIERVGDTASSVLEVHISDNGVGVGDDDLNKIFNPFYTTKPTGIGHTGLGLSLAHDIVSKGHGGVLAVSESELGGATFSVTIPLHE